jgi:hypothetical protein
MAKLGTEKNWQPEIDQSVFLINCPQFKTLPKADVVNSM